MSFFEPDHTRCDHEIQRLANQVSDLQEQLLKQQEAHTAQVEKLLEHYMGLATPENLQAYRYDPVKRAEQFKANSEQFRRQMPRSAQVLQGPEAPFRLHGPPKPDPVIEQAIKNHAVSDFDTN